MAIKTIGFIGIGNMGRPMATNLVKGGFQVVACDADPARAAQFAKDAGAKSAATLAELGKSVDAIVTMLPTGKEVRACLLEIEAGALAGDRAGWRPPLHRGRSSCGSPDSRSASVANPCLGSREYPG